MFIKDAHVASRISGTTWISNDAEMFNSSLFSLWRVHSSLLKTQASNSANLTIPRRVFFPSIDPYLRPPDGARGDSPRNRIALPFSFWSSLPEFAPHSSLTPTDPPNGRPLPAGLTMKAAFPGLGLMYAKDWSDFADTGVPVVFERAVVMDIGAARRVLASLEAVGEIASGLADLEVRGGIHWWDAVRANLVGHIEAAEEEPGKPQGWGMVGFSGKKGHTHSKVVVYLAARSSTIGGRPGMRINDDNHRRLVDALTKMAEKYSYDVHVIDASTPWKDRMSAIARASVRSLALFVLCIRTYCVTGYSRSSSGPFFLRLYLHALFNRAGLSLCSIRVMAPRHIHSRP